MYKKSFIIIVLVVAFVLAFSSMASAEFVKGFDKNLELYPNWIGVDAQGLPTTMPIFNYSAAGYINEIVWVEVPCDTDRDGVRDRVSVWIRRPVTQAGFLCPVVMEFSPYHYGTVGWSRVNTGAMNSSTDPHVMDMKSTFRYKDNVNVVKQVNPDTTDKTYDDIKYKGIESWDSLWWQDKGPFTVGSWYTGVPYGTVPAATVPTGVGTAGSSGAWAGSSPPARWTHYFVRGYAMVYGQLLGNRDSFGITSTLYVEEIVSSMAVIKWLNGEATAFTSRNGTIEVKADWANGHVAMDGTSYPGTTPIVTAMTGVQGLKAIMPEAHVGNWYDYYRASGVANSPAAYGGEDLNLHASFNFSRFNADTTTNGAIPPAAGPNFPKVTAQEAYVETQKHLMEVQDPNTGDYNTEWDFRNMTRNLGHINSDVGILQTNGLMDWNVKPKNAYLMLQAMQDRFAGVHKTVSALSVHASQAGTSSAAAHRLVPGRDGVNRGMLKWYLMFLDHFLLGLDNHVDELMYDLNIANNRTGEMETWDLYLKNEQGQYIDEAGNAVGPADKVQVEKDRGVIAPTAAYQKIYLQPAQPEQAGTLSYHAPVPAAEHFKDLDLAAQILAPLPYGTTSRPATTISTSGDGNLRSTSTQTTYCEARLIGVNRTTNYSNQVIFDAVNKPVEGRLMFLSEPFTERTRLSGTVVVQLNAAPDRGTGNLSAALVEIGRQGRVDSSRTGSSVSTTGSTVVFPTENGASSISATRYANPVGSSMSNFKYVTVGYTDVQNPNPGKKAWFEMENHNYIPDFYFQTTAIVPGQYYNYTIEMDPYDYTFEPGMRWGIMVFGTDVDYSQCLTAECTAEFDVMLGADSYAMVPLALDEPTQAITVVVGSASVALGDEAEISYSVKDNIYGFTVLDVELPFDSSLYTPVTVTPASLLGAAELAFEIIGDTLKITVTAPNNIVGDGTLFTVTYQALESAPYIFATPLDLTVKDAKFGGFMDKTVDLDVMVSAGVLSTKLVGLVPVAYIEQLNGNKNDLTITVTEIYEDGTEEVFTATFSINNNAADTYTVGPYKVYVDTKGNDQIRDCYVEAK